MNNKDNKKSKHKLRVNEKNKHSKLSKAFNHQGIYEHKATSFYNLRWSNLQRSHTHTHTHTCMHHRHYYNNKMSINTDRITENHTLIVRTCCLGSYLILR